MSLVIEIDPPWSCGTAMLGRSQRAATQALRPWGVVEEYKPWENGPALDTTVQGNGVDILMQSNVDDSLLSVRIRRDFGFTPRPRVMFRGMDVFGLPAAEVVAVLEQTYELQHGNSDYPFEYTIPELRLTLGRDEAPDENADAETREKYRSFHYVQMFCRGYYDGPLPGS